MNHSFEKNPTRNQLTRSLISAAAFSVAMSMSVGCSSSSSSTSPKTDAADAEVVAPEWEISHAGWSELGYEWQWTGFPPLQPGAVLDHATAYDDILVFQGSGSTLSVLETNTGKVRWSRQVDRPATLFQESVRRGETLYTASDTDLWEFNLHNGNTIDRDALGTLVNTSPLLVDNLAIFGTLSGELFAFEMVNDFKLWSYRFDGPINTPAIQIDDNYIAAISENGEIRSLETVNAHTGMSTKIAGGSDANLVSDGVGIYVASKDQSLYAFDAADGFRFWRVRSSAPVTVQHTLHEGVVYATTNDTGLAAIDSATGEMIWNNESVGGWVMTVSEGNELIVWSGYELLSIDKDRGDVLSRIPLEGIAGIRTNSIDDGDLYVVTLEGSVAKFSHK
ncbi:MAG: PQQ-binding-like beta-propeller repeat protein [Phycisphaerales bacterium]|nr:PQQ-binding-like beta-propeller repeat protein [Phycisphaerales bacterium]